MNDSDRDSLHTLPLAMLPMQLSSLARARMVKDSQMRSMVEMFKSQSSGSGLLEVSALPSMFEASDGLKADLAILKQMEQLHSYDVYSLRIELRRLGIPVSDQDGLRLSESKAKELTAHMTEFTRPLLQQIYGGMDSDFDDIDQLLGLFRNPDKDDAIKKLRMIADRLGIQLIDVPVFLEEYGDVFLSLSYYRSALDNIVPRVTMFLADMEEISGNTMVRQMPRFEETREMLQLLFDDITVSIMQRFESFDRNSKTLWDSIDAATFQAMKEMIEAQYVSIGGVLSGLMVKMDAWEENFGSGHNGPIPKANFIMSDMRMGMDHIYEIEKSAPPVRDLH